MILWDVDGTLVRGKGARVIGKAFTRALKLATNADSELVFPNDAHGKTDSQIVLDILAGMSIVDGNAEAVLASFAKAYVAELEAQRQDLLNDMQILLGVVDVLATLKQSGVTQSLLTGNLEPVARLKLGLVELDQYVRFDLGAFGSDHPDRTCLVPIARQRAREQLGQDIPPQDIVVVGDTPRDIACARAGGAWVVCVATGNFTREELQAHGPDAVLDDLQNTQEVVANLLRYST